MVGIVQWQNARLWLWMSWVRPPLPTPKTLFNPDNLSPSLRRYNRCEVKATCRYVSEPQFTHHWTHWTVQVGALVANPGSISPIAPRRTRSAIPSMEVDSAFTMITFAPADFASGTTFATG